MKRNWVKAKTNPRGHEQAAPKGGGEARGGHSNMKRAPVKTWAQMTEAERRVVLRAIQNGGKS
jgi:hypothetical protein